MRKGYLTLKEYNPSNSHLLVRVDNTVAWSYIRKMGGIHSEISQTRTFLQVYDHQTPQSVLDPHPRCGEYDSRQTLKNAKQGPGLVTLRFSLQSNRTQMGSSLYRLVFRRIQLQSEKIRQLEARTKDEGKCFSPELEQRKTSIRLPSVPTNQEDGVQSNPHNRTVSDDSSYSVLERGHLVADDPANVVAVVDEPDSIILGPSGKHPMKDGILPPLQAILLGRIF